MPDNRKFRTRRRIFVWRMRQADVAVCRTLNVVERRRFHILCVRRRFPEYYRRFWDSVERIHAATPSAPCATVPTLRHWMTSHVTWSRGPHASIIDPSISIYSRHSHTYDDLLRYRQLAVSMGRQRPRRPSGNLGSGGGRFSPETMLRPQFVVADVPPPLRFYRPSFHDSAIGPGVTRQIIALNSTRTQKRSNDSHANRFSSGQTDRATTHTHTHARTHTSVSRIFAQTPSASDQHTRHRSTNIT